MRNSVSNIITDIIAATAAIFTVLGVYAFTILTVLVCIGIKFGIIGFIIYCIIWLFFPDSVLMMKIDDLLGIGD